mgnify:CR=1 FL=1
MHLLFELGEFGYFKPVFSGVNIGKRTQGQSEIILKTSSRQQVKTVLKTRTTVGTRSREVFKMVSVKRFSRQWKKFQEEK